jgi:hypothetical protein
VSRDIELDPKVAAPMIVTIYRLSGLHAVTCGAIGPEIRAQWDALPRNHRMEVDLSGVTVTSGAFAHELIGMLMADRPGDPSIVFVSDSEMVRARVAAALQRRRTAAWMRRPSELQPVLIGAGSNLIAG